MKQYYKVYKSFYVDLIEYNRFKSIVFLKDKIHDDNCYPTSKICYQCHDKFCIYCGYGVYTINNYCYNNECLYFITKFSYMCNDERIFIKDKIKLSDYFENNNYKIDLCIGIKTFEKKISIENILFQNFLYDEFILLCLYNNKTIEIETDLKEIINYIPKENPEYSKIELFENELFLIENDIISFTTMFF